MSQNGKTITVAVGSPLVAKRGRQALPAAPTGTHSTRPQTPPIDIHEQADGLVLEADLPGVVDQSVNIQLEDNVLSLSAQVPGLIGDDVRVLHQEFASPGVFHRSFILSDEVDRGAISAELKNGVLRLHLPRAEQHKSRRIEVKGS
jgi:HSP20 family protein